MTATALKNAHNKKQLNILPFIFLYLIIIIIIIIIRPYFMSY